LRPESSGPFDLCAFSSRVLDAEPRVHYVDEKIPGLEDSVFLAVIKRRDLVVADLDTLNGLRETGFICRPQEQHSSPPTI